MSDLIDRQAALEKVGAMQTYKLFMGDDMILVDKAEVQTELMMLPTVQPEPKEGHWIEGGTYRDVIECYCSECGQLMTTAATVRMNFCPNCGAKMINKQRRTNNKHDSTNTRTYRTRYALRSHRQGGKESSAGIH